MATQLLHRWLFPNAPSFRRTDGDAHTGVVRTRVDAGRFARATPLAKGLQTPSLISSCEGSIDSLLFIFPKWAVSEPKYVNGYRSVIAALRPGTSFHVAHHSSVRAPIEEWFTTAKHGLDRVTFVPVADYISLTDWAEDAYVCLIDQQDSSHYLMEPWSFLRGGDALVADAVEEYSNIRASQAPLIFQGGNCLIGKKHWLLGRDYFADTIALLQSSRAPIRLPENMPADEVSTFVEQLFGRYVDATRKLILIGPERELAQPNVRGTRTHDRFYLEFLGGAGQFQPIFHIDMFITLVGENASGEFVALVGDPRLADQILGTTSPFAMAEVYDDIAANLVHQGYKVLRNPLVHQPTLGKTYTLSELAEYAQRNDDMQLIVAVTELRTSGATDATSVTARDWHHITWNNCLVENSSAHGRHVYLPTFGHGSNAALAKLDKWMAELWDQQLKFKVHLLADFNPFAERQGVVHCIKKYLRRGA